MALPAFRVWRGFQGSGGNESSNGTRVSRVCGSNVCSEPSGLALGSGLTCGEVDVPRGGRFSRVSESELLASRGEELGQRSHARADGDGPIQPGRTCERWRRVLAQQVRWQLGPPRNVDGRLGP